MNLTKFHISVDGSVYIFWLFFVFQKIVPQSLEISLAVMKQLLQIESAVFGCVHITFILVDSVPANVGFAFAMRCSLYSFVIRESEIILQTQLFSSSTLIPSIYSYLILESISGVNVLQQINNSILACKFCAFC